MKEVDITEILRNMKKGTKTSVEKNEMVKDLVVKIERRAEEIKQMRETETEAMMKQ